MVKASTSCGGQRTGLEGARSGPGRDDDVRHRRDDCRTGDQRDELAAARVLVQVRHAMYLVQARSIGGPAQLIAIARAEGLSTVGDPTAGLRRHPPKLLLDLLSVPLVQDLRPIRIREELGISPVDPQLPHHADGEVADVQSLLSHGFLLSEVPATAVMAAPWERCPEPKPLSRINNLSSR